jgi:hypothetical protein
MFTYGDYLRPSLAYVSEWSHAELSYTGLLCEEQAVNLSCPLTLPLLVAPVVVPAAHRVPRVSETR